MSFQTFHEDVTITYKIPAILRFVRPERRELLYPPKQVHKIGAWSSEGPQTGSHQESE